MPTHTARPLRTRLVGALSLMLLSLGFVAAGAARDGGLHDLMEDVKSSFRTILRGLSSEAKGEGEADGQQLLDATAELQRLLLLAKAEEPSNLDEIDEAGREAHVTAYRMDMARTLIMTLEMEIQLLEGDHEAALELAQDKLLGARDEAHEKYQEQGEDGGGRGRGRGGRDRNR